jgi:elongation factor 3
VSCAGELEPDEGTVWKHPNLRLAYVAQHAFHHIEQHLGKSPNQYIQWRYASGEDREEAGKVSRVLTEEEQKALSKVHVIDGKKLQVDKIVGRRKLKKSE